MSSLIRLMIALSTDSTKLMALQRDPDAFLAATELSEYEKSVVKSGDSDWICQVPSRAMGRPRSL